MAKKNENLLALIKQRRTHRQYRPGLVPFEDVMKVLEAARWAPSGKNCQPWEFVVVRDENKLLQVIEILLEQSQRCREKSINFRHSNLNHLRKVSTFIVVCADPRFRAAYPQSKASEELAKMYWENSGRIYIQSIAAAISNILLAATSLGLSTTWITGTGESITEQQLKVVLNIPKTLDIMCCIPLGYPSRERPSPRTPRPLSDSVHFDEFDVSKWRTGRDVERYTQDKLVQAEFFKTGKMPS